MNKELEQLEQLVEDAHNAEVEQLEKLITLLKENTHEQK